MSSNPSSGVDKKSVCMQDVLRISQVNFRYCSIITSKINLAISAEVGGVGLAVFEKSQKWPALGKKFYIKLL